MADMTTKSKRLWPRRRPGQAPFITDLYAPHSGGSLFSGMVVTRRLRRYSFSASPDHACVSVFREEAQDALADGRSFWVPVPTPPAIRTAILAAIEAR